MSSYWREKGMGWLGVGPPDYRDYLHDPPRALLADGLPDYIDLRDFRSPKTGLVATPGVFDQEQLGSCTANATNAAVQYVETLHGDPDRDRLSRLFTYWHARAAINTVHEDSGAFLRDCGKVVATLGVPREKFWPYRIEVFTDKPVGTDVDASAPHHRALEYRSFADASYEHDMQASLAEGYPFTFGFAVYDSFYGIISDGVWDGERGPIQGYHAVAAWGYDFRPGAFGFPLGGWIVRNSWGEEFGDEGYFYVPRPYMAEEAFDPWTFRQVAVDPVPA